MVSQLLIDMPAEGAARLLTLSWLEQLSQFDASPGADNGDSAAAIAGFDAYRAAVTRLRSCIQLYADALGESVGGKPLRSLRELAAATERVHRSNVQIAWVARHARQPTEIEIAAGVPAERAAAAFWLQERLARRRQRALKSLQRAQRNARLVRRLGKRLGVYTTAVRIDDMPLQRSFASLTAQQIVSTIASLRGGLDSLHSPSERRVLRQACELARDLGYLLDPLRARVGVEGSIDALRELRDCLDRLYEATVVGRALIRAGRRVGGLQATAVLEAILWRPPVPDPSDAAAVVSAADLQQSLIVLTTLLREEVDQAYADFVSTWDAGGADRFVAGLIQVAGSLAVP